MLAKTGIVIYVFNGTEDEKYEYIHKYCFEYLMDSLEIGIEDIELEID